MKQQIQEITQNLNDSWDSKPKKLLLPKVPMTRKFEESEEDIEVDEDGHPIMMFDRILRALQSLQLTDTMSTETQTMEEDQSFQPTVLQETSCELTKEKFNTSICKILPDAADFPDDLFNVEGCVWCGPRGHGELDCLGYASWLIQYFHLDQHNISYEEKLRMKERIMSRAKEYHNPRRPWELYIGKDDGEYLTGKGVKILVRNKKIVNLIPRHLQTTTTTYADLPIPGEVRVMLKHSDKAQSTGQISVMEELCNQSISFKEDLEQLQMELKTSLSKQSGTVQKDFQQEMQKFYTALMDNRIAQLPKQFDQMRDFLSKTMQNLHQRSLQSDLMMVKTFRDLFESRTPDSNMMWKRELCTQDPTYQFRGRWRQLVDRLNTIADYTIKSNLVIPITGNKHADDLRTMGDLLMEVMQQMFYQAKILEYDDLLDIKDLAIFQEIVCRTMQLQAISSNQVCNFIQQMVYYSQCTIEKTLDFLNY